MLINSILVLEDNYPDFLLLKDHLSDFGFYDENFYRCSDLDELDSEPVSTFSPTFIFADLNLGDSVQGLDTFLHVQRMFPSIPIVIFTGVDDDQTALDCIQAGAQNFLIKGNYTSEQLHKTIRFGTERNRLKQEVERLKADYQRIFDENPAAILIADCRTLKFVTVNKTAIKNYGYSLEEFKDLQLYDLSNQDKNEVARCGIAGSNNTIQYTSHYKKNGEIVYVDLTTANTIYNNTDCVLITAMDVTGKVHTEQEERRAKQRLEAIFNGASDAFLLTDNEGRYVQVNPAAGKMLGYTTGELLSMQIKDVVKKVVSAPEELEIWEDFKREGHQSGIIELNKKNGQTVICLYNAVANIQDGLHLSIVTDITERESARRKIAEQGRRIDTILESITDCFFTVDTDWIVTYWNKAAENLLNLPRENVIGKNLWTLYDDLEDMKLCKEYQNAVKEQVAVHFEDYYPAKSLWMDISAYPSADGLTVYFKDITDKKNLELEILQTKNRKEALINSTDDLMWSIDQNFKLTAFNAAFKSGLQHFTGVTPFAGMQLPISNIENKFVNTATYYKKVLQGEPVLIDEMVYDNETNKINHVEISFKPLLDIHNENVIGAVCYSRNITERKVHQLVIEEKNKDLKASEEHLKKLTAKLEKVMDSSIDIICTIDKEGNFVQVSAASFQVWGYDASELINQKYFHFVDPDYIVDTKRVVGSIVKGRVVTNFENRHIHKNGASVPMIWSVRWDRDEELMFCIAKDASDIKEAERMKAETEERFSALVQKGADLVGIMDEFGNYKYISPPVKNILGYDDFSITGRNALEFVHPEDTGVLAAALVKMQEHEERKHQFRFRHANGEWRWLEAITTKLVDNPAIKGIVINSRDITQQKRTEAERELIIKELVKSNADLKQFSFITSHNMRAPLSNILGILRIIDYTSLDAFNQEMIKMIETSTRQLNKTIEDLANILVIKNNSAVEKESVSLSATFREVQNTFFNTINDICVTIETDFQVELIQFNQTYLNSIFVNLVSNSIKYRSPDRNLTITAKSRYDENGSTVISFSDNGTGMDLLRHKDRVFGLYQRFHDNVEGHGLGLFIIKSQIEALGGKIRITSQPDEGTTFTVTTRKENGKL